jgi:hypothetical protein
VFSAIVSKNAVCKYLWPCYGRVGGEGFVAERMGEAWEAAEVPGGRRRVTVDEGRESNAN